VGDLNGDGKLDLVASTGYVFLGNGDGTFQAGQNIGSVGPEPESVAVGDFNGDGILDVAVASANPSPNVLGEGFASFRV
jgi:FG-GAP-like repeat